MMRVKKAEWFFVRSDVRAVGVKRVPEQHHNEEGNSTMKGGPGSRPHPNDRRSDFRYDAEYNPSK